MLQEVPYMVMVVGMRLNLTTWPLEMRVGEQRKFPLIFEVPLSTAGYKSKSAVMYTDMEVELFQSRHSMVPAVPKLPRLEIIKEVPMFKHLWMKEVKDSELLMHIIV